MTTTPTIVALSSGAVPAGVAVMRLSGPAAAALLVDVAGALPPARRLSLRPLRVAGEPIDTGLVAWFPAPNSFTGEDCGELHVHGSPAVVRRLLRHFTEQPNVRLADAGEFTRRAFENGRLDLTEVEGLGDLIEAETENQRRQAVARAAGGVTRQLENWRLALLDARAELEAQLDFSDEGDVGSLPPAFAARLAALAGELQAAAATVGQGRIVREGFRVALAGPPNAGKSSLLNALAKSDIAIVTDEAGTTRDVREVPLDLDGQLVVLVDMAGLRDTDSKAEGEGVRRARAEIATADLVLWLDAPDVPTLTPEPAGSAPIWRIRTKADTVSDSDPDGVSAKTGHGLPQLLARISAAAADAVGGAPVLMSRERDREALLSAAAAVAAAQATLDHPELAAEDLRSASAALERLLGTLDAEAVLDRLFSSFCIGK